MQHPPVVGMITSPILCRKLPRAPSSRVAFYARVEGRSDGRQQLQLTCSQSGANLSVFACRMRHDIVAGSRRAVREGEKFPVKSPICIGRG